MSQPGNDPALLGYADKLSARPGDTLNFKVSSFSDSPTKVHLMRSISADPNPAGTGIVEKDASEFFKARDFQSRVQSFYPGSYGVARNEVSLTTEAGLKVSVRVYPTLRTKQAQTLLCIDSLELYLDEQGHACFSIDGAALKSDTQVQLRHWYRIDASITTAGIELIIECIDDVSAPTISSRSQSEIVAVHGKPSIAARLENDTATRFFNGKIENPYVLIDDRMICGWDFSQNMASTMVPGISGPALELINFPARAMTSSDWDGSEMSWSHKPAHYAAIHFHEDDIYDFGWDTDFTFTVPSNMPSGVYVMRLSCGDHEDAIPFFVLPPKNTTQADLCVLVSTFTYSIYGNHARPDYEPWWQKKITDWSAYPHNPAVYPQYGLSTYNYHTDGSGICHASHRRPLFNLKPGYLTFGYTDCSGLRHSQADSHLISWLHEKNIDYDIVTDQELHDEGHDAIADYKVVTTGSHPEYHTSETLDALQTYRDSGGHLCYLGGNGFYWRIAIHPENPSVLEIRRAEDGIRAWAAEPGEYYNAFDGQYGGLWRRNGRPPQKLVGVGFAAQGNFFGDPYRRVCKDPDYDWIFAGIDDDIIGDFGFSGNGAAGFELDHMDHRIGTPENAVLLARSVTRETGFVLVPEEQLTHITNLSGGPENETKHADMVYTEYPGGGSVFSTGSITFCGSLPWNAFDNNVSQLLLNVMRRHLS